MKDKIEKKKEVNYEKEEKTRVNRVNLLNSRPKSWVWDNLIKSKLKKKESQILNKSNVEGWDWNWKKHKLEKERKKERHYYSE